MIFIYKIIDLQQNIEVNDKAIIGKVIKHVKRESRKIQTYQ